MNPKYGLPQSLMGWVDKHRDQLKPPVCNAAIFPDGDYIINMVGGGNTRTDFHDNPTEEIFYQIRGTAYLNTWENGRFGRIDLKEGDIFLQPPHLIHSPQRPDPNGLCLLIERPRPAGAHDALQFYCPKCAGLVWRATKQLESLVDGDGFPDAFKAEALELTRVLTELRASDDSLDWFFLSPAANFGAYNPGERTGHYRVGGDVLLTDEQGTSAISGEDLAKAVVDEIEQPAHRRERFTVAY